MEQEQLCTLTFHGVKIGTYEWTLIQQAFAALVQVAPSHQLDLGQFVQIPKSLPQMNVKLLVEFVDGIMKGNLQTVLNGHLKFNDVDAVGFLMEQLQVSHDLWKAEMIRTNFCEISDELKGDLPVRDAIKKAHSFQLKEALETIAHRMVFNIGLMMEHYSKNFGTSNPNVIPDDETLIRVIEENLVVNTESDKEVCLAPDDPDGCSRATSLLKACDQISKDMIVPVMTVVARVAGEVVEQKMEDCPFDKSLTDVLVAILRKFGSDVPSVSSQSLSAHSKYILVVMWWQVARGTKDWDTIVPIVDCLVNDQSLTFNVFGDLLVKFLNYELEAEGTTKASTTTVLNLMNGLCGKLNGRRQVFDVWIFVQTFLQWAYQVWKPSEDTIVDEILKVHTGLYFFEKIYFSTHMLRFYNLIHKKEVPDEFVDIFARELRIVNWKFDKKKKEQEHKSEE